MNLTRRRALTAAGALAASAALPSCGFVPQTDSRGDADTLLFTTWGTDAELAGFRAAIAGFERTYPGRHVALNAVPYEQMFTNIDAQLQAGDAPDIFRVPYYSFGAYAGRGQLLDLSRVLNAGVGDRFTATAWAAVQANGRPFGVPHHTDTSAILVNTDLMRRAGISKLPASADEAWTWDELSDVATRLRQTLPSDRYPFAYNWQGNGVTRWLSLLFQADGAFLDSDQQKPAINSAAGLEAVTFAQHFFAERWVPANSSVKSTTFAADSWFAQTVAMVWSGAFQIPDAAKTVKFGWTATYPPRKARGGGDFGGNALVATAQTEKPDLAASFLDFVTRAEQMRDFCTRASLLPTRRDLIEADLRFAVRPELTPVFLGQAAVVQPQDVAQVASPDMAAIITTLKDGLEQAFVGMVPADETLRVLERGISAATGGGR